MNMLLALLIGSIISVMVSINGNLTRSVGPYLGVMIVHIVGTLFAWVLCIIRRKTVFRKRNVPVWAYCGGVFGIMTSLFQSSSYGYISMTSIVALGLLGQSMASTVIDGFGLLGMKKRRIGWSVWIGLAISCVGAAIMMDASVSTGTVAVCLALSGGITVVITRTINAKLAKEAGPLVGSCYNHMVGLVCSILLWLVMRNAYQGIMIMPKPWMLVGGMFGVFSVLLFNIAVPRLSAFRLSLLSFLGQMFTGFLVDVFTGQDISGKMFWGSICCALGFLASLLLEYWEKKRMLPEKAGIQNGK